MRKNSDLSEGSKVRLSLMSSHIASDLSKFGRVSEANPNCCPGTVVLISERGISVDWENGFCNNYSPDDSDLISLD